MAKRKGISTRTRFEIFKRDGFICQYCGGHPPQAILHVDHITPVAGGGGNEQSNLITACSRCNFGKAAIPLTVVPQSLKDQAVLIAEREKQIKGYNAVMQEAEARVERDAWMVLEMLVGKGSSVEREWLTGAKTFIRKLGLSECLLSMDAAMSKIRHSQRQAFRYFCGTCWKKIKRMEEEQ